MLKCNSSTFCAKLLKMSHQKRSIVTFTFANSWPYYKVIEKCYISSNPNIQISTLMFRNLIE